jgi:hypothetical protein
MDSQLELAMDDNQLLGELLLARDAGDMGRRTMIIIITLLCRYKDRITELERQQMQGLTFPIERYDGPRESQGLFAFELKISRFALSAQEKNSIVSMLFVPRNVEEAEDLRNQFKTVLKELEIAFGFDKPKRK